MINGYEIKKINNEEILYLYVNFNQEFAKLNSKKKKEKINKTINKYIKDNKINFKGTTVALVASGLIIGTLMLKTPNNDSHKLLDKQNNYIVSILDEYFQMSNFSNEETFIGNQNDFITSSSDTNEYISNKQENEKKNPASKVNESIKSNQETTSSNSSVSSQKNIDEESTTPEVEEDSLMVTIYRSNGTILNLELEEYLIGVVAAEMPASFNSEALKAQAIIARTYTLKSLERENRLTDTSSTQNYKDEGELKEMWGSSFNSYYNKVKNAVKSTDGIYLTYKGEIIDAVYHSTSNGQTENSEYVWGNSYPYLVSVESSYDSTNKSFYSENLLSYEVISQKLQMDININTEINILSKTVSNRVEKIKIDNQEFSGVIIRSLLGLRSTDFEFEKNDTGILFKTKGYGHGVGLSQYGANGMANAGYSYEQILKHYYTGVSLNII